MKKTWKLLLAALLTLALLAAVGLPVLADDAAGPGAPPQGASTPEDGSAPGAESTPTAPGEGDAGDRPEEAGETTPPEPPEDASSPEGKPPEAEEETPVEMDEQAPETKNDPEPEKAQATPYGLALSDTAIVVTTYDALKKALGEDNGFTTVYLGASITAEGSPAPIHPGKPFVVIDGSPPSGGRHTFTQYAAANQNGLFLATDAGTQTAEVTLRNMNIIGKNSLGVAQVSSGTTITLENVNYTGPQALYHRGGTVRVIGGSYTLPGGELAEALHAELGGALTIEGPPANAVLWLTGAASTLRVLPGANVQINTGNYFVYGTIAGAYLEAGARLALVSRQFGFSYAADSVGTFTLAEGAQLYIDLHTAQSYAALRVSKRFEMAPGSSATLLRTGTAGISLRLTAAGAQAVFNQPQRVFFYSGAGVPLRFTGAGTLSIATSALNVWKSIPWPLAGGMGARPSHLWNKAGSAGLTVNGTYYETANRSLSHNLSADDPVLSALDANSFNLEKNQLLAFGAGTLELDPPAGTAAALTGTGDPGAQLLATYTLADGQGGETGGSADAAGRYSLPVTGGALLAGSEAAVLSRWNDLFIRKSATVRETGEQKLAFLAVPEQISFGTLPVPAAPLYAERQQAEFGITVQDTRAQPSPWRIDVSLADAPDTAGGAPLPSAGAVVFITKGGQTLRLNDAPQTIYRHTDTAGGTIDIQWARNEGVLLNVAPGEIYSGLAYQATVHWALVDAP